MSKLLDWWANFDKSEGVKLKDIPEEYKESLNKFMFGQTCLLDEDTREEIFYSWDVEQWVYINDDTEGI